MTGMVDAFQEEFRIPLTRVGFAQPGEGVFLQEPDGTLDSVASGGFSHFPREEEG